MGSSSDQAKLWGNAAQEWMENFEPQFHPLWNAMLERAQPLDGKHFLDAGCGSGGASVFASKLGASITGIDATPEFTELCKSRIPEGDFRTGDLEDFPYSDNTFDVIFAANAVQFTYDPTQALCEFKRVMKPGGMSVVGIFTAIERNDLGVIFRAYGELMIEKPRVGPFALSASGLLDTAIHRAGLNILRDDDVHGEWRYENPDHFWHVQSSAGPTQQLIAKFGEQTVRETATKAVEPLTDAQGKICLKNSWRVIVLKQ